MLNPHYCAVMQLAQLLVVAGLSLGVGFPMLQPTPAMTGDYLYVENERPVVLDGYINAANELQIAHGSQYLVDYDQSLWAEDDDYATITVRIYDFGSYTISASHGAGGTNWSRGTNYAYYTFGDTGSFLPVDVEATNGTQTLKIKVYIKTVPKGSL
jgi:hypothetical protein